MFLSVITSGNLFPTVITSGNVFLTVISGRNVSSTVISGTNVFSTVISGRNMFSTVISGGNLFQTDISGGNVSSTVITSRNLFPTVTTSRNMFLTVIISGNNCAWADATTCSIQTLIRRSTRKQNIMKSTWTWWDAAYLAVLCVNICNLCASMVLLLVISVGILGEFAWDRMYIFNTSKNCYKLKR